jgi:hypothetical protein
MAQNSIAPLLFVNKNPRSTSLSNNRSDQTSRQKINKHVQQTRDVDRERLDRIHRLNPIRFSRGSDSGATSVGTTPKLVPSTTLPTPPYTPLVPANVLGSGSSAINDAEVVKESSPGSDLTQVIPEGGTVEPFGVCKVPLDNERYRILQYFVLEMFPAISRSDTPAFFTEPVSPGQQAAAQMIRDCLTDEMHTYALLTASSARMKFLTRTPLSQADLPEQYADTTMHLLRKHLARNETVDERLILTIFFLWAIESYRRNWNAVRTHQEMIKYLYTKHLGGFHSLNYHLRKMIWFGDRFQATATATPPVIEETWGPQEISPWVVSRVLNAIASSAQVPMGSAFAVYTISFFTPEFRILVHEVTVLACVVQCHWTDIKESYPDPDWVNGRSHALLDKLLFFNDPRLEESIAFAILLQDCVRLSMITWLAFIGSPATGVASKSVKDNIKIRVAVDARPLRRRFATMMFHADQVVSEEQRHEINRLLLWIAGLGGVASEVEENIAWFCERFQELATQMDIHSWVAFTPIGRGFLWLDRLEAVNDFRLTRLLERQNLAANGTPSSADPVTQKPRPI